MTRQTSFEQLLSAFLEQGHEVTIRKDGTQDYTIGNIIFMIDIEHGAGRKRTLFMAPSLEEIGEIGIGSLVSDAYKMDTDQGGAGKTRIDGGDDVPRCQDRWHRDHFNKKTGCPSCSERWKV